MADKEAGSSRTSSLLKFIGGAILLLSAIVQNFVYDSFTARANSLSEAMHDIALVDKGGLINQADYYILSSSAGQNSDRDQLASQHLQLFALKLYESQLISVSAADGFSAQDKSDYLSSLHSRISSVHDYRTASDFMLYINSSGAKFSDALDAQWSALTQERSFARLTFLALYLVGALIALAGPYLDWRKAGSESAPDGQGKPRRKGT